MRNPKAGLRTFDAATGGRASASKHSARTRPPEAIYCGSQQETELVCGTTSDQCAPSPARCGLDFESFDAEYVRALTDGHLGAERHFTAYFGSLIRIKLRSRRLPPHVIEDIRQETFLRVFVTLRRERGLEHPERLGAFVNSVCNNVFFEYLRSRPRHPMVAENAPDPVDFREDAEAALLSQEHRKVVEQVLAELPRKDEQLLRTVLLDERDKSEVCQELEITRENLRVILHRAKSRFREILRLKYPDGNWFMSLSARKQKETEAS